MTMLKKVKCEEEKNHFLLGIVGVPEVSDRISQGLGISFPHCRSLCPNFSWSLSL